MKRCLRWRSLAEGGKLPAVNSGNLELVYGNMVLQNFNKKNGGGGYWETGELPDIDLAKDSLFLILDQDAYYQSSSGVFGEETGEESTTPKVAKKYAVKAAFGVVKGGIEKIGISFLTIHIVTWKH